MKKYFTLTALFLLSAIYSSLAQTDINEPAFKEGPNPVEISGQWFLAYQSKYQDNHQADNLFTLKRGYLTFKKDFNRTFSVRFTQDITLDKEGEDAGNVEMRLKYLYLKVNLQDLYVFKNSYLVIGMIQTPWMDFEQHINDYRVQSPMFLETSHLISSADFGVNVVTLLGGKIDEEYRENVSSSYPGKYGSITVGILNGGGYHAIEKNNNKTIAARLSLRPFPATLPGLQFSLHGVYGKGNSEINPDFNLLHTFISYESARAIITAQAFRGLGNSSGTFMDFNDLPYKNQGTSVFGELYLVKKSLSLIGSYGYFERMDLPEVNNRRFVGGICYHFLNNQKFLLDIDHVKTESSTQTIFEAALEIRF